MKYWTLFTIRMMARVGLATAIMMWWATQSSQLYGHFPARTRQISVGAIHRGWMISRCTVWSPGSLSWGFVVAPVKASDFAELLVYAPVRNQTVPGVEYRHETGMHLLIVRHWLITLTFLIATVGTSWRWKPKDVQTEEPVTENEE